MNELRQMFVLANEFKEGDLNVGGTGDDQIRREARGALAALSLGHIARADFVEDQVTDALHRSLDPQLAAKVGHLTVAELKRILLSPQGVIWIEQHRNGLSSEAAAAVVKIMPNEELGTLSRKLFNPLPGRGVTIGSQGHLGSRIQPNSPGDDETEILLSILEGLAYGCGDVILGLNPASDDVDTIIRLEQLLQSVVERLELPTRFCVLSDIVKQTTARSQTRVDVGFQSLAGTSKAISGMVGLDVDGLLALASGFDGLYFETGQGSAVTNQAAEGVDMVTLEARAYGIARLIRQQTGSWMIVNDVAGFIGPEVFRTGEQLLRACLEDTVMAKLHGITMGLDVCATFHMGIGPSELRTLTEQVVVQATPAYLMAVAGNADPMLGYMTTSFREHPRLRSQTGRQIASAMQKRLIELSTMTESGAVSGRSAAALYAAYHKAGGDTRSSDTLREEGAKKIDALAERGFDLGYGCGDNYCDPPEANARITGIYSNARRALYSTLDEAVLSDSSSRYVRVHTRSSDRDDYLAHPSTGELIDDKDTARIQALYPARRPQVQLVVSDGLNANAINENLRSVLPGVRRELLAAGHDVGEIDIVIGNGRVRAGYQVGSLLEAEMIIHLIGERPGTGIDTLSAYLTYGLDHKGQSRWKSRSTAGFDHSWTTAVCGIHHRGKTPERAVKEIATLVERMFAERCSGVALGRGLCLFLCALLFLSPPVCAQTTRSVPQARQARSDLSRSSVREWQNRVLSSDAKIRASAVGELVQGAGRSLPLLRRFLNTDNDDLHDETFEIIRRIGPPAIPLLLELLRDEQVSFRRFAADAFIDLTPDTVSVQPALRRALRDEDSMVAADAARALGALHERASPSVPALVKALSHKEPHVRIYTAEALASIGPNAATATKDLARSLRDPIPGVRWAAAEALASIGPAAHSAVPQLIEALQDKFLYVRICAAGALGSIGPKAHAAESALRAAANEPVLRHEVEWALNRIAGVEAAKSVASIAAPAASIALQPQTTTIQTGNPPIDWDTTTGRNIVWSVELGNEVYGSPVIAGDVVYVGADNSKQMNPAFKDDAGVLMAFRATDGAFLWQDVAPRVERGLREWLLPSTTSVPYVEGDRLYYVTADCQLRCLDTKGFGDGQNDGPYQQEIFKDNAAADIVWQLDIPALGVFPHEACNSEVLALGDLVLVSTSNGQNEGHTRVPSPRAPSLIAVNKHSGELVWRAVGPGDRVLHGDWSSPVAANVNGRIQVLHGGGDGVLRAYDATSGQEVWRFDGNPKNARYLPRAGVFSRSSIIASPVFADGRVFIAMGQSPGHFNAPSFVYAIDPNGQGDVTKSGLLWTSRDVGRVVATPIVKDGLLYVGDVGGTVHCLDAATGAHLWKHETNDAIWGCFLLAGNRLYVGNAEGLMTVLRAGRRKELLAQIEMDAPLYSRPFAAGGVLYLATANHLYAIVAKP